MELKRDLSGFPDAVLIHIFGYLPVRERLRCARVCRRWYPLVQDKTLWRCINLTPYRLSSKVIWHLLRNNLRGSLRILKARGSLHSVQKKEVFTPALMRALGKQCPRLSHLCLTETDLRLVPYNCIPSSLTTLELTCCEISSGWFKVPEPPQSPEAFPRIKHLVIKTVPAFSNEHLLNIAKQGTLKSLVLSDNYQISSYGIMEAAPYMQDLEHLALRPCNIGDQAMHAVGQHMKHLRHLDLGFNCSLTDRELHFLGSLPNLHKLCLEGCHSLTSEAIVTVCQALPQLKCLDVRGIKGLEKTVLDIKVCLPSCVVLW